jgi:hypothetical protein
MLRLLLRLVGPAMMLLLLVVLKLPLPVVLKLPLVVLIIPKQPVDPFCRAISVPTTLRHVAIGRTLIRLVLSGGQQPRLVLKATLLEQARLATPIISV